MIKSQILALIDAHMEQRQALDEMFIKHVTQLLDMLEKQGILP